MNFTALLNTLQTVISMANVVLFALAMQLGCTTGADGRLDCSAAWFEPATLVIIAGVLNFLKFVVLPWLTPGGLIRNLFGDKTVVTSTPTPGTVSPADVR